MPPARKIAFIGSHAVRKTNAVHSFAGAVGRGATLNGKPIRVQVWAQRQANAKLELRTRAEVLVLDRAVIDNFAYFLRVTKGKDPFDVTPLVANWSTTYDLYVRLRPDTPLLADGVRSTNERFRNEIEKILDVIVPKHVPADRLIEMPASHVTDSFDWPGLVERLCGPAPQGAPAAQPPITWEPTLWD